MRPMSSDAARQWAGRRETTNLVLGTNIVVLAAGFIRLGDVGPWTGSLYSHE